MGLIQLIPINHSFQQNNVCFSVPLEKVLIKTTPFLIQHSELLQSTPSERQQWELPNLTSFEKNSSEK